MSMGDALEVPSDSCGSGVFVVSVRASIVLASCGTEMCLDELWERRESLLSNWFLGSHSMFGVLARMAQLGCQQHFVG